MNDAPDAGATAVPHLRPAPSSATMLTNADVTTVLERQPDVADALHRAHLAAARTVPTDLLDLCARRVAELLGAAEPGRRTTGTPRTARDRAALAFVEQWVIDVAGMDNTTVANLVGHVGDDGIIDLCHALLVVEQRIRLGLTWTRLSLWTTP